MYRSHKCYFPMRCEGVEYFILKILEKEKLPDMVSPPPNQHLFRSIWMSE
jgi:hypothetical protein